MVSKALLISVLVLARTRSIFIPRPAVAVRNSGQKVWLVFGETEVERHVLTLDEASLADPLAERSRRRARIKHPNDRHRRLLRARRERPRRRAADERDELAPSHQLTPT